MKEKLKKAQAVFKAITESKKYKWYQRGVIAVSTVVAGYYIFDSVPYYNAIGEGKKAFESADYPQAEKAFQQANADSEKYGTADTRYLSAINNMAELKRVTADYKKSEDYYRFLVRTAETQLKPNRKEIPLS